MSWARWYEFQTAAQATRSVAELQLVLSQYLDLYPLWKQLLYGLESKEWSELLASRPEARATLVGPRRWGTDLKTLNLALLELGLPPISPQVFRVASTLPWSPLRFTYPAQPWFLTSFLDGQRLIVDVNRRQPRTRNGAPWSGWSLAHWPTGLPEVILDGFWHENRFRVCDLIDRTAFFHGQSPVNWSARIAAARQLLARLNDPQCALVTHEPFSPSACERWQNHSQEIVLRKDTSYTGERTKDILRYKVPPPEVVIVRDLVFVDTRVQSVVVAPKGSSVYVSVAVPFTVTAEPEILVGSVCTVRLGLQPQILSYPKCWSSTEQKAPCYSP